MRVFLAFMIVLLIVLLIFAVQNPSSTKVSFITFSSTVPLLLIILVSAVVGLLLGIAALLPANLGRSSHIRKLESELRDVESELRTVESELRTVRARSTPQDSASGITSEP